MPREQLLERINNLNEEQYDKLVTFIIDLSDFKNEDKHRNNVNVIDSIYNMVKDKNPWCDEEDMIQELANDRKQRIINV